MDWKDCGEDGFMVEHDGETLMIATDAEDLVCIASFATECALGGTFALNDDNGDPAFICDDPAILVALARDLLTAAMDRRVYQQAGTFH